jgi:hypothetical protein
MASRPFLVYCPVKSGRHVPELFGDSRIFDVALNEYQAGGWPERRAEYRFGARLHKWPAIVRNLPALTSYRFYAFLDDDIEISTEQLNRLFLAGQTFELYLYQAALTPYSGTAWPQLRAVPGSYLRPASFVEIMSPIFSARALTENVALLAESESGWGLDLVWSHRARQNGERLAVIDAITMRHPHAPSSKIWKLSNGLTPMEEMQQLCQKHGVPNPRVRGEYPIE